MGTNAREMMDSIYERDFLLLLGKVKNIPDFSGFKSFLILVIQQEL